MWTVLMELINCNPIYCARSRFPLLVAFKTHSPLSTFQCIDKNHLQRGRCERFYFDIYFAGLKRALAFFFCSFEFWNSFIFMSKFHSGSWFIFFWKARLLKLACKTILYLHAFPPAIILCLTTVSIYMSFEIFITLYIYANSFIKMQKTVIA